MPHDALLGLDLPKGLALGSGMTCIARFLQQGGEAGRGPAEVATAAGRAGAPQQDWGEVPGRLQPCLVESLRPAQSPRTERRQVSATEAPIR